MIYQSTLKTKSGRHLHPIGIGTWGFGAYPTYSPGTEGEISAIRHAVSLGQNHIDTAEMYENGGAEQLVGQAIASLGREELFIASKLWKNHVAKSTVRPAVKAMLRRLNTDYLDMLYIHAPWFDAPWQEAIPQIDELIDEGLVRHFGVSNFNTARLQEALDRTSHTITANQMHFSCIHQQEVTPELRQLCETNGVTIVSYMPLEKGDALNNSAVTKLALQKRVSTAQVALAWVLANQALPIPKASNVRHIEQNAKAHQIQLLPEEISYLNEC